MSMWMWGWEVRGEVVWWWEECSPEGEGLVKQCQALCSRFKELVTSSIDVAMPACLGKQCKAATQIQLSS